MTNNSTDDYIILGDIFPYSITYKLASKFTRYDALLHHIQLDAIFTPHDVTYRVTKEYDIMIETTHIQRAIDVYNTTK